MVALECVVVLGAFVAVGIFVDVDLVVVAVAAFVMVGSARIFVGVGEVDGEYLFGEGFDDLELSCAVSCFFVGMTFSIRDSRENLV